MRKSKLARAEIARLYTEGLFTMQEIGVMAAITCFHAERVINPERYVVISQADRRKGSRVARNVVHHIDGDPTNNNWGGSDRASLG